MAKILIVDDELSIVEVLKALLERNGHVISTSSDGKDALRKLKEQVFDLLITDIRLPEIDGISLLRRARELQSHLAVIVITAYAKVDNAVEAMKNGAFDYVTKPFKFDELLLTVQRALSYEEALAENEVLRSTLKTGFHFDCIVGDSDPMLKVYHLIEKVAKTDSTVLILGDSGTGKELVAKALHFASPRFGKPFVTINCTAMPEPLLESELFGHLKGAFTGATSLKKGLFEMAEGGTIFLDEIGSVPPNMQMKLLRVLQEKEIRRVGGTEDIKIDVRVVAATNEDLEQKIQDKLFREDLYYRLSVIPIKLAPLRDRKADIPLLVNHFMQSFIESNKRDVEVSPKVVEALSFYDWPGNVRELENLVKRLATLCDKGRIEFSDLPEYIREKAGEPDICKSRESASGSLKAHLRSVETNYIQSVINEFNGDKEKAAERLGISIATLYRKINDNQ
ncbi:MAG: sigma-54-dependent Fis family transcriptional regulator [Victivallales bacterium]|nr:sigma-54-dependent Fis family transcriptional regulator [Victivallales bacterium]